MQIRVVVIETSMGLQILIRKEKQNVHSGSFSQMTLTCKCPIEAMIVLHVNSILISSIGKRNLRCCLLECAF